MQKLCQVEIRIQRGIRNDITEGLITLSEKLKDTR